MISRLAMNTPLFIFDRFKDSSESCHLIKRRHSFLNCPDLSLLSRNCFVRFDRVYFRCFKGFSIRKSLEHLRGCSGLLNDLWSEILMRIPQIYSLECCPKYKKESLGFGFQVYTKSEEPCYFDSKIESIFKKAWDSPFEVSSWSMFDWLTATCFTIKWVDKMFLLSSLNGRMDAWKQVASSCTFSLRELQCVREFSSITYHLYYWSH